VIEWLQLTGIFVVFVVALLFREWGREAWFYGPEWDMWLLWEEVSVGPDG